MRRLLPVLVLTALPLAVSARLVARPGSILADADRPCVDDAMKATGRPLGNDLTFVFLPHHGRIAAQVARRGLPSAWDPAGFGGRPRVGNPQAGLFYPPDWIAWACWQPATLTWLTVAHLVWAGLGTYALARRQRLTYGAAIIAGIVFELSPYVLAQAYEGHYPHVWTVAWYPWAFWAQAALLSGDRRGALALAATLSLALLAGHPQEWAYLGVALAGWAAADGLLKIGRGEARRAFAAWAGWLGALALHVGLTAVEWLPDAAMGRWAPRSPVPGGSAGPSQLLRPVHLLQLLSPRALGGPHDYFGGGTYWGTLAAFGVVPLVLIVVAWRRSPRSGLVRGWSALGGLALVYAGGRSLGLLPLVNAALPLLGRFRAPTRTLFLASLAAALLAGLGAEALGCLAPAARSWARSYRRVALGIVAVVVGLACWPGSGPPRIARAASAIAHDPGSALALVGVGVLLAYLARRPDRAARVAAGMGALAAVELVVQGLWLWHAAPAERFLGPDPVASALARLDPGFVGPYRIRAHDAFYDDLHAVAAGVEKTNLNDYFQIGHAADLYGTLYPIFDPPRPYYPRTAGRRAIQQAVLDRMNVAFLVSDHPEPGASWPVAASGTWRGRPFQVYRNPGALPRAYVVPRAVAAADGPGLVARFPEVSAREAVFLPEDPLGPGPRQPFTPAEYDGNDPDRVVVRVSTAAPGLLVVADTWMPGWTAEVDGRPAPVLRGNRAQRVIPLPAGGRHVVTMTYRAPLLAPALAITGGSVVLWAALLLASLTPRTTGSIQQINSQLASHARTIREPLPLA